MKIISILIITILLYCCPFYVYAESLTGKWITYTAQGNISLEFLPGNRLNYDNELTSYQIIGNVIRVPGDFFPIDYPYTLKNGKLFITYPEGYQLTFKRAEHVLNQSTGSASTVNQNYRLQGLLCSYSSSGGYYGSSGSYSSSRRVQFDGQGLFRTNTESAYSGDPGGYYGQGDNSGGSYEVKGNNIYLRASDGTQYQGEVIEQSDNRITGISINNTIYGSGLCD